MFYYIDALYDNNPMSVIDVGCGECLWKDYFPHITGMDMDPSSYANHDIIAHFDKDFSNSHTKEYDCGMALGSLHYCSFQELLENIDLAMNIVKDRFLFTLNFDILGHESNELYLYQESNDVHLYQKKVDMVNDTLTSAPYNIVILDYPTQRGYSLSDVLDNGGVNGHVRFILEHKKEK
jgi:hypothetical protein